MPRYTLEADDVVMWEAGRYPTQVEVDATAVYATEQGWNGTQLDCCCDGVFRKRLKPNEEALSGAVTVREIWEADNHARAREFGGE